MTKEEFEKEAEEYVSKYQGWGWTPHKGSAVYYAMLSSYIDSAEPREKRIAELKKENTELKEKLNNLASVAEERLANWQKYEKAYNETEELLDKQIEATYKVAEENKELKSDFIKSCKVKEQGFKEAEQALERKDKQLTKAKEIINTFLGFAEAFGYSPSMDKFISEAEQFLKEE